MPRVLPRSCHWLDGHRRGESLNKIQEHGTSVVVQACALGPAAPDLYYIGKELYAYLKYIQIIQRMTVIDLRGLSVYADIKCVRL